MTFYYTNEQAARLMFYHDHAYGITRLNVYAGVAAGYLITDAVEQDLIAGSNASGGNPGGVSVLPTLGGAYPIGIPLVIQDKTFVNTASTPPGPGFTGTPTPLTAVSDPLWFTHVPGSVGGNLWLPHEYLPNENIYNAKGFNDTGRWDYGPWMIPPMPALNNTLPSPTIVPEAFMDTAVVNGTAFPYVNLPPTLVRFRILNACNDRMLNLQLYKADPLHPTEVKMVTAAPTVGFPATWPRDGRDGGVPDPTTAGPDWWQIGNECGMLAKVAVIPQQPVDFDYNRRSVTFGAVTSKALLMPPAVRADVIVDLSKYTPGDTLILYNDAPAPMPLYDTRYDYFTGDPDQTAIGGAPTTMEGFGPNTRTMMQIRITTPTAALTPPPANYLATLQTALPLAYAQDQDPPVVPEAVFNPAYNATYSTIYANALDETLNATGSPQPVAQVMMELPGQNYTTAPIVSFYGGGGTGAAATATLNGVTGLTVLTVGSGYTSPPTVTITAAPGDTGVGATAAATVQGGMVTSLVVTNPGSNYLIAPTVTFTGGGAAAVQATAQANITLGSVGTINLTNPGTGYTSAPRVYLTGGGGTGATALALLNGSMVMTGKNLVEGMDMEFGPAVQGPPGAPTAVGAIPGDGLALVSFAAPASNGGSIITGYTASATDGVNTFTGSGPASPVTILGLTNGVTYSVTVTAVNGIATGPASSPAVSVTPAAPSATTLAIDATVWKDQGTAAASVVSAPFSTTAGNELLLAFIAADASATGTNVQVNSVTGGTGLTWTLVRRANTQRGTAEIWYAFSPTVQTNITVTAALSQTMASMITVMSFTGVDTTGNGTGAIGASGTGNSAAGAPTAGLVTTRANSWVLGVGCDWSAAINRTVGTGQTMVHQYLAPVGDTYWVQRQTATTPALGTTVTINDTAPTVDRYNLSIIEIRTP